MPEELDMPKNAYDTGETCPVCGEHIWAIQAFGHELRKPCKCKETEAAEWAEKKDREQKQKRLERRKERSQIPKRFEACALNTFSKRQGTEQAFEACKSWLLNRYENIRAGRGLIIAGPAGTGKTHLGAAILNCCLQDYISVFWDVGENLLKLLPDGSPAGDQQRIMEDACKAPVLLLDDLGAEKPTEWTQKQLTVIINDRYKATLPTIITTNWVGKDLCNRIGERCYSRLMEVCDVAVLTATDYRREKR